MRGDAPPQHRDDRHRDPRRRPAWLLTASVGADSRAAVIMGVIPARLSGLIEITPAVPAWLTPLTSTLVHGGPFTLRSTC